MAVLASLGTMPRPSLLLRLGGIDKSGDLDGRSYDLTVTLNIGFKNDTFELTIFDDDPENPLITPTRSLLDVIDIYLGYDQLGNDPIINPEKVLIGRFNISEMEIQKSRAGRFLKVSGSANNYQTKNLQSFKTRQFPAQTTVSQIASVISAANGLNVYVDSSIGSTVIGEIIQDSSDKVFLTTLAKQYDFIFKIDNQALLILPQDTSSGASDSVTGRNTLRVTTIIEGSGQNSVILEGTKTFDKRKNYNVVEADYKVGVTGAGEDEIETYTSAFIGGVDAEDVTLRLPLVYDNESTAAQAANAKLKQLKRITEQVQLKVLGDPGLFPGKTVTISIFDRDFDGTYYIDEVKHSVSSANGFTTTLKMSILSGGLGAATGG